MFKKTAILVYPGLRHTHQKLNSAGNFFSKNVYLSTKLKLRLKKTTKNTIANFKVTWKNFRCRNKKKTSHTISIYGKCIISTFWQKIFLFNLIRYTPKQEKISRKLMTFF